MNRNTSRLIKAQVKADISKPEVQDFLRAQGVPEEDWHHFAVLPTSAGKPSRDILTQDLLQKFHQRVRYRASANRLYSSETTTTSSWIANRWFWKTS